MKLAVCGCSFSAVATKAPNTHWSEILAGKMNAELHNLARQGISNGAIRIQIDEAIRLKSDVVIIGATSSDRIILPRNPNAKSSNKLRLRDFNYDATPDSVMLSETLVNIIDGPIHRRMRGLTKEAKEAAAQYATYLHDVNWQRQLDRYVLQEGLWALHELGIKFYYNPWFNIDGELGMPDWFTDRYFLPQRLGFQEIYHDYKLIGEDDPGYHISPEGQHILANELYEFITKKDCNIL